VKRWINSYSEQCKKSEIAEMSRSEMRTNPGQRQQFVQR
jgi:hypothetical protein